MNNQLFIVGQGIMIYWKERTKNDEHKKRGAGRLILVLLSNG